MKRPGRLGFTLIELMLVVAIIGLLAAIALPKFANLVVKAKEASVKGKLGSLRSAISLYYADNEGTYPGSPGYLINGNKYLDEIPTIEIPLLHSDANGMTGAVGLDWAGPLIVGPTSSPAWRYALPAGMITVNCTHTDTKGTTWSLW